VRPLANILIMGDFNDEPTDESLSGVLGAEPDSSIRHNATLLNLMGPKTGREGTHKYQGRWAILDQFIVTNSLLNGANRLQTGYHSVMIFKPGFILKEDSRFFGDKPSRTFNGPKYEGGFSDHLPVSLEIWKMP
jgi:endonuclease/exonuclease/phosphatase family metal-dependent hydrolase